MSGPDQGGQGAFPDTRWSLVVRAGEAESLVARAAVEELCQLYYHPLYVFALRTGFKPQDAMDLTQGFFEFFLRTKAYTKADPERGKLRSLLLASFKNFAAGERRNQSAAKRGGGREVLPLEAGNEAPLSPSERHAESPAQAYDRACALILIDLVTKKLEDDYSGAGKSAIFRELKGFLSGDPGHTTYAKASAALGLGEGATRVAVHRMRHRFRELFRQEVSATLADPAFVDEEVAHLKAALAA